MELACSSCSSPRISSAFHNRRVLPPFSWKFTSRSTLKAANFAQFRPSSSAAIQFSRTISKTAPLRPCSRSSIRAFSQAGAAGPDSGFNKILQFQDTFSRFLRPHTIRGTTLGSISLVARAIFENPDLVSWSLLVKALYGLFALICGNGYIVGINQIYDVGIDKVNKPYLPIAAGDLSVPSAWILVKLFAVAGLVIVGINFGPFICSLYALGLFLGTIYSVPPFRMKRFPTLAFLIIATVQFSLI
ncbi:unnamed protein product [Cuscuta campestris]|uniref:Homogentisate phytyltransferase n=1 Tax=Cuscuta campestris TaxID=132261 RepID=A0A484KAP9_9ASTE|nr:unnamed protein product [Cuscuta campestris]